MPTKGDESQQIAAIINLHGHIVDAGAWERLGEVFDPQIVMDLSAFGSGSVVGTEAVCEAALALGSKNPLAHHVTNIVVTMIADDSASAVSKGFGIYSDGSAGSVTYEDQLRRGASGWRIIERTIKPRRIPLSAD